MAVFSYQAKALGGKVVKGDIEATSIVEARVKLRAQQLIPVKLAQKGDAGNGAANFQFFAATVKPKDLQIFTRQFATLINSGIPIVQSLQILGNGTPNPTFRDAILKIKTDVEAGRRLADSMQAFPAIFDYLYTNLIRAGEEVGVLDTILNRLSVYIEKSVKLRNKVKGAMFYPVAVIFISAGVIAAIMTFVIPKFEKMFSSMGQELPWLTVQVIGLSHWFQENWYLLIGAVVGLVVFLMQYAKTKEGRRVIDIILIQLPLLGNIVQKAAIARFSRTLSTMLSSGVGVLEALEIAGKTVGSTVIEETILAARATVQEGKSMVSAFAKNRYFPDMVVQMIGIGEQTGALDVMLGKVADFYEEEVDYAVGGLTSLIEPLLMVGLGGVIAVLVIAMYLPIFNIAGGISGG